MIQRCNLVKIFIAIRGPDQRPIIHDQSICNTDSSYSAEPVMIIPARSTRVCSLGDDFKIKSAFCPIFLILKFL